MNLHKLIFTKNACYKAGKKITPKGIRDVTERREKVRTQYSGLYQALGLYDTVKLIELLKKLNRYIDEM